MLRIDNLVESLGRLNASNASSMAADEDSGYDGSGPPSCLTSAMSIGSSTTTQSAWALSSDTSPFLSKLRFPLNRIMDTNSVQSMEAPMQWPSSSRTNAATSASSATPEEPGEQEGVCSPPVCHDTSSSSDFVATTVVRRPICIEELQVAYQQRVTSVWDNGPEGYFQLAQNTATSLSVGSLTDAQEEKVDDYREWL